MRNFRHEIKFTKKQAELVCNNCSEFASVREMAERGGCVLVCSHKEAVAIRESLTSLARSSVVPHQAYDRILPAFQDAFDRRLKIVYGELAD